MIMNATRLFRNCEAVSWSPVKLRPKEYRRPALMRRYWAIIASQNIVLNCADGAVMSSEGWRFSRRGVRRDCGAGLPLVLIVSRPGLGHSAHVAHVARARSVRRRRRQHIASNWRATSATVWLMRLPKVRTRCGVISSIAGGGAF